MYRIASLVVLLFLGLSASISQAQETPGGFNHTHVDGGIKLGANLSKLDGQNWDGGYKTNLLGGAFLAVHGSRFGIQLEGLFSQTSYITGPGFDSIYHQYIRAGQDSLKSAQFRVSYFNIPIMVEVHILNRVWFQIGPQYSGVVSVRDKDEFAKDAEGLFNTGTISGVVGLNIEVTRHLNAGARYVMGFSDFNKTEVAESWKQRDIQIHIGYKL